MSNYCTTGPEVTPRRRAAIIVLDKVGFSLKQISEELDDLAISTIGHIKCDVKKRAKEDRETEQDSHQQNCNPTPGRARMCQAPRVQWVRDTVNMRQ